MKIVAERYFEGSNSYLPVSSFVIVLGGWEAAGASAPLSQIARMLDRAMEPISNAFVTARLKETYGSPASDIAAVGELIADLALVLQRQFVCTAAHSKVLVRPGSDELSIAYEARFPLFARTAGRCAVRLFSEALNSEATAAPALADLIAELKSHADKQLPALETRLLLEEADRRGIPWFRLIQDVPLVQLGQGALSQRFRNSLTDGTGDTAYRIASYKPLAAHILRQMGVPMPRQAIAENEEAAVAIATRLGYPVVVKPVQQDMGVGVKIGIADESELRAAFRQSLRHGKLQIESHLPGFDYRFTFINGSLVSVLRTRPPILRGDGHHSVRNLLEAEPVSTSTLVQRKIIVDEEVLERVRDAGYGMDDILPAGSEIQLRRWWRNKLDHVLENVTDATHPENIDIALLAVEVVGLDVAGVDYITTDISRPYHATGGAFTEVNPMPALAGVRRSGTNVYPLLLDARFRDQPTGRIPIALLLGDGDRWRLANAIEHFLRLAGHRVGIASNSLLSVDGSQIRMSSDTAIERMWSVLRHPRTTAAFLQVVPAAACEHGLGIERCDVGLLLSPAGDAVSASDIEGAKILAAAAQRSLILDTADPRSGLVIDARGELPITWIAVDAGRAGYPHRRRQDTVVSLAHTEAGAALIIDNGQTERRLELPRGPLLAGESGESREGRTTLLFAVAAVLGMGVGLPPDTGTIADCLRTGS